MAAAAIMVLCLVALFVAAPAKASTAGEPSSSISEPGVHFGSFGDFAFCSVAERAFPIIGSRGSCKSPLYRAARVESRVKACPRNCASCVHRPLSHGFSLTLKGVELAVLPVTALLNRGDPSTVCGGVVAEGISPVESEGVAVSIGYCPVREGNVVVYPLVAYFHPSPAIARVCLVGWVEAPKAHRLPDVIEPGFVAVWAKVFSLHKRPIGNASYHYSLDRGADL